MTRKLTFDEAAKVMRAAQLEPIVDYPGLKSPWKCKCLNCQLEVSPTLASVRANGGGCRNCGLKKMTESRRTSEKEAVQFMKNAGAEPLEPYKNSKEPWLCRCLTCEREIHPTYGNVKNNGTKPCAYCSKKKVHPDDALKLMQSAGVEPLTPFPCTNKKWKSRH